MWFDERMVFSNCQAISVPQACQDLFSRGMSHIGNLLYRNILGFVENVQNNYRVHFLNDFLFLAGSEGLGKKNFRIWTQ
jgi:hypothetical protein